MGNLIFQINQAIQYNFIQNAIIAGIMISLCFSFLGLFLVLKNFSLIGDGLGHISFAAAAFSLIFSNYPIIFSIPFVSISALVIMKLHLNSNLHTDTAIGMVSAFSIAIGILISSISNGLNVDLFSYLFGSILMINKTEVIFSVILSIILITTIILFYNDLFAISYDEDFAKIIGIKTNLINYIIALLTAISVSLGIRLVGTMLISSLIIFPTASALQIAKSFKQALFISASLSITSLLFGIFISYLINLPTASIIVIIHTIIFLIIYFSKKR